MLAEITVVQGITLAIAVLGAVLGVINTWQGLDKSRVKLLVRPKHAIPIGGVDPRLTFCIEVINLSAFAVTVEDVGVLFKGTDHRGSVVMPVLADGGPWPRRLEPRSSVTVYSQTPSAPSGTTIKCAYAKTQCGYTKTGTTPALKQIARHGL
jgi:hypothetical protein